MSNSAITRLTPIHNFKSESVPSCGARYRPFGLGKSRRTEAPAAIDLAGTKAHHPRTKVRDREGVTCETVPETRSVDPAARVDVRPCSAGRARHRPRRARIDGRKGTEGAGLQGQGPLLPAEAGPLQ